MSMRQPLLYVEPKTLKRLRLALILYPQYRTDKETGIKRAVSPDEFGDRIINEMIDDQYPLVKGLEKAIDKTEKEYLESNKQQ